MTLMPNVSFEIFRDAESLGIFRRMSSVRFCSLTASLGPTGPRNGTPAGTAMYWTPPQEVELKAGDGIRTWFSLTTACRNPFNQRWTVRTSPPAHRANARFRFEAVDGSFGPVEYTTLEDGTIDLSKLPADTAYIVTELECPAISWTTPSALSIWMAANRRSSFLPIPSCPLHLHKESADGTPLGGVTYRLAKIEDGSRYLDRTSPAQVKSAGRAWSLAFIP